LADKLDVEVGNSLLTIVVPVHNMSGRLDNLSEWLDHADFQNVKVILVHDKSDDTTGTELLKLLERKNSHKFSLIQTDSQSPGLARNCGLEVVDTPWFSFVDADDSVSVPSILELLRETETSDCKIGVGAYVSSNLRTGEEILVRPPAANSDALPLHLAKKMGLWRLVLSTSSFGDIRFTNHKMGEDFLYISLLLNRSNQIFTSSKIVYKYFYGGDWNLTSNRSVMSEMIGVIKCIKKMNPNMSNAVTFKVFAIQKLTLSVLKNLRMTEFTIEKSLLFIDLLSHPIYLLKLLTSLKKMERGPINE